MDRGKIGDRLRSAVGTSSSEESHPHVRRNVFSDERCFFLLAFACEATWVRLKREGEFSRHFPERGVNVPHELSARLRSRDSGATAEKFSRTFSLGRVNLRTKSRPTLAETYRMGASTGEGAGGGLRESINSRDVTPLISLPLVWPRYIYRNFMDCRNLDCARFSRREVRKNAVYQHGKNTG